MKEKNYIRYRKLKALGSRMCFLAFSIFPIKKNRITVCAFEGKSGFACNPKYIVEELHKRNEDYEFIWFVNDMEKEFPAYIRKVKNNLINRAYWLSTSKVWIDNYRKPFGTRKRKGQTYINTWHGTLCIKPIGKYRGDLLPKIASIVSEDDSKNIDYVLSGSGWCDKHYPLGLLYNGNIIRTGSPRCDIIVNRGEEEKKAVRERYNIPLNAKILMYAPTFRGGSQSMNRSVATGEMQIDFNQLIASLEKRFGGEWYILLRLHPQLAAQNQYCKVNQDSKKIRDATQYRDMNELIAGVDAFVTDYSSAIFEACLMKIPCFIYADDLEDYIKERGDLFFNMYELPFPIALNNDELIRNIDSFNEDEYQHKLKGFIEEQDITEDGKASQNVAELIEGIV